MRTALDDERTTALAAEAARLDEEDEEELASTVAMNTPIVPLLSVCGVNELVMAAVNGCSLRCVLLPLVWKLIGTAASNSAQAAYQWPGTSTPLANEATR